jgi:hypothetical protein
MQEQRYQGGCQCGAVSYEVTADLGQVITCNCSRCKPMGFVLAFAKRADFELKSGRDSLTEYRFNTGTIEHLFCSTCGVESFAYGTSPDGTETVAINVNCLEGVDARALPAMAVDGKSA